MGQDLLFGLEDFFEFRKAQFSGGCLGLEPFDIDLHLMNQSFFVLILLQSLSQVRWGGSAHAHKRGWFLASVKIGNDPDSLVKLLQSGDLLLKFLNLGREKMDLRSLELSLLAEARHLKGLLLNLDVVAEEKGDGEKDKT